MARLCALLLACFVASASAFFAPPGSLLQTRPAVQTPLNSICMATAKTKATRTNIRNREYNKKYKSEMRTRIKAVSKSLKAGDYDGSFKLMSAAQAIVDKNVKRGIIHKNTAARRKSRMALQLKNLEGSATDATPEAAPAAAPEAVPATDAEAASV